jgi:hypothetical protein
MKMNWMNWIIKKYLLVTKFKMSSVDAEQLRVCYEGILKHNPSNLEAIYYLAVWHLERHSFQQVIFKKKIEKMNNVNIIIFYR